MAGSQSETGGSWAVDVLAGAELAWTQVLGSCPSALSPSYCVNLGGWRMFPLSKPGPVAVLYLSVLQSHLLKQGQGGYHL